MLHQRGPDLLCEAAAGETPVLTMAYRTPKEGLDTENSERIDLNVEGQDGSVVPFMIKSHIPLRKLMKAYCE